MEITKENLDNYEVALTIEVEADKLAEAKKTACKSLANRYNFPGFRKGKAPQKIIEQQLGKQFVLDEAADVLIQKYSVDALKEENLQPFTRPDAKIVTNEDGKNFIFKITFTPYPEVKLGQYKGLEAKAEIKEVTDEDVDKQVKLMQEHHATLTDAAEDEAIVDGDFITLDFEGYVNNEPFEGGTGKSYPLKIGSKTFIPGFEDALIGAKVNEERDVEVTFPEDYHSEDLAGKPATFKCKILSIKHQQLPELNDEFAAKVSSFKTLDEFKADIRKNMEAGAKRNAIEERGQTAIKMATDNITVDLPPVMVEYRITQLINKLTLQLQARGMTLENYMQYSGNDMEKLRASYSEEAKEEVLTDLMLEEVAKAEDIKVEPKEFEYEIAMWAAQYGATPKQVVKILKEQNQLNSVAASVLRRKAARFIIDNMVKDETLDADDKSSDKADNVEKSDKTDKTEKVDKVEKTDKADVESVDKK